MLVRLRMTDTDTPQMSSLAGCIAAVNNLLCDTPSVDLSRDRTALSGKFPEDELKAVPHLNWWRSCLQKSTLVTWFGSMDGEVTG